MIRVVHANDPLAYEPGAVYIGRCNTRARNPIAHAASPWRNRWSVRGIVANDHVDDETALVASLMYFERWAHGLIPVEIDRRDWCREHIHDLAGATLVCWCAEPGTPLTAADPLRCHGQLLATYEERGWIPTP